MPVDRHAYGWEDEVDNPMLCCSLSQAFQVAEKVKEKDGYAEVVELVSVETMEKPNGM